MSVVLLLYFIAKLTIFNLKFDLEEKRFTKSEMLLSVDTKKVRLLCRLKLSVDITKRPPPLRLRQVNKKPKSVRLMLYLIFSSQIIPYS